MTPDDFKTLDRLVKAVDAAYSSPSRMFWRGFLWGLGRGLGSLVGWLLLLAILVYLFKISGLESNFNSLLNTLGKISNSFNSIPR